MFQFPTNGKVYPKRAPKTHNTGEPDSFNSLRTGRCIQSFLLMFILELFTSNKFQFPTNGKVYPKKIRDAVIDSSVYGFNSLRTGRCIQRKKHTLSRRAKYISFQFPTNGKVYPKEGAAGSVASNGPEVSIPYEREGVSKEEEVTPRESGVVKFQFPTNGKVYPKSFLHYRYSTQTDSVSIPYEREGVSKEHRQFQKHLRRPQVSIPYEREGVSKVYHLAKQLSPKRKGFNSLRTGRCIQSQRSDRLWHPLYLLSFNSLRTGRCIQRKRDHRGHAVPDFCFNSLRTGRCIQSCQNP